MKKYILFLSLALLLGGCSNAATAPAKESATTNSNIIQYAFTQAKQHPETLLEDVIKSSKETLDIAIYSLTKKDIVDAIAAAKKRGVMVRIITDKTEASSRTQSEALATLKALGIPIKVNTHSGLMHLKVTIADKAVITTGSFNYTQAAATTNDEVLVVMKDRAIAADWEGQFERMWNDGKGFSSY